MSEEEKVSYDDFKEFHERHPDLDNSEYYAEFPDVNKGTLRSWKAKAQKNTAPPKQEGGLEPTPPEDDNWNRELFKLLCTQTNTPMTEFENVDLKSSLIILKNRLANQQNTKPKSKGSNGPILPNPPPIGQNKKEFPIDKYIEFDLEKDEIRMEIPLDELMDPAKNRALRGV